MLGDSRAVRQMPHMPTGRCLMSWLQVQELRGCCLLRFGCNQPLHLQLQQGLWGRWAEPLAEAAAPKHQARCQIQKSTQAALLIQADTLL